MIHSFAKTMLGVRNKDEYWFLQAFFLGLGTPFDFVIHRSHENADDYDIDSRYAVLFGNDRHLSADTIDRFVDGKESAISLRIDRASICMAFKITPAFVETPVEMQDTIQDILSNLRAIGVKNESTILYSTRTEKKVEPNSCIPDYIIIVPFETILPVETIQEHQSKIIHYLLQSAKHRVAIQPLTVPNGLLPLPFGREWTGPLNKKSFADTLSLINQSKIKPLSMDALPIVAGCAEKELQAHKAIIRITRQMISNYSGNSRSERLVLFALYIISQINDSPKIPLNYSRLTQLTGLTHQTVKSSICSLREKTLIDIDNEQVSLLFDGYDIIDGDYLEYPGPINEKEYAWWLYYRSILYFSHSEKLFYVALTRMEKSIIRNICS